jgi:glycosyltransferase involved in cell wall biosynthesis
VEVKPLVSVCVVVYQQVDFIRQCLDSILRQKTSFPIEVLIGEDGSTDGTAAICEAYAKKYPGKIKLFLRSRKDVIYIDGKPTGRFNFMETLKSAQGKYIALCEGDDYWTDDHKLQVQVDFLEQHPGFSICFHAMEVLAANGTKSKSNDLQPGVITIRELAQGNYIHTASCVYRHDGKALPDWFREVPAGDYALHMLNASRGQIRYFDQTMAVYRVHGNGLWSEQGQKKQLVKWLDLQDVLIRNLSSAYTDLLIAARMKYTLWLASIYEQENEMAERDKLISEFFSKYPQAASAAYKALSAAEAQSRKEMFILQQIRKTFFYRFLKKRIPQL